MAARWNRLRSTTCAAPSRCSRPKDVKAVAICFMNAFANPAHEAEAAALVRKELPGAFLTTSTELLPAIRFYDRVSTTALNAYVGPILDHYLAQLQRRLSEAGFGGALLIMQSNGGVMTPEVARKSPALTLLSGPAGGPIAGLAAARPHGKDSCIVVDMGGTSFEAALVEKTPVVIKEGEIDRLRCALPMLGIHTIGAGGGSIGWIDQGGLAAHGAAQRRRDAGAGLLRPGRRVADHHRRQSGARLSERRFLLRRPHQARCENRARGHRQEHRRAARHDGRSRRRRHVPRRLHQHGAGRARGDHRARQRSARISACGRRRRRPAAFLRHLQRSRHRLADRAARKLGAVRVRHADGRPAPRFRAHLRRSLSRSALGQAQRADRRDDRQWRPHARRREHRAGAAPARGDVGLPLPQAIP